MGQAKIIAAKPLQESCCNKHFATSYCKEAIAIKPLQSDVLSLQSEDTHNWHNLDTLLIGVSNYVILLLLS